MKLGKYKLPAEHSAANMLRWWKPMAPTCYQLYHSLLQWIKL